MGGVKAAADTPEVETTLEDIIAWAEDAFADAYEMCGCAGPPDRPDIRERLRDEVEERRWRVVTVLRHIDKLRRKP